MAGWKIIDDELIGIFTSGKSVKVLSNTIGNMTNGIMTYYSPATPKTYIENNRIGSVNDCPKPGAEDAESEESMSLASDCIMFSSYVHFLKFVQ